MAGTTRYCRKCGCLHVAQVPEDIVVTIGGMLWRALDGGREDRLEVESLLMRKDIVDVSEW